MTSDYYRRLFWKYGDHTLQCPARHDVLQQCVCGFAEARRYETNPDQTTLPTMDAV